MISPLDYGLVSDVVKAPTYSTLASGCDRKAKANEKIKLIYL